MEFSILLITLILSLCGLIFHSNVWGVGVGGGVVLGCCTSPSGKLFFITQEPLGLCYTHERNSAQNLVVNIFKKNT